MRLVHNKETCTFVGMCEAWSGDIIEITREGSVQLRVAPLEEEHRGAAERAVAKCPTGSWSLLED